MVLIADGGGGGPTLNPKAKHYGQQEPESEQDFTLNYYSLD